MELLNDTKTTTLKSRQPINQHNDSTLQTTSNHKNKIQAL